MEAFQKESAMQMAIAGINFDVRCQHPLSAERLPGAYRQFIKEASPLGTDINVIVRIETGTMPDTGQMTKIFDTGQSWSMFRRNNDYILSLNIPTADGQAIWLAAFDSHCSNISIYCSDLLMNKEKGLTTFATPLCYPLDQLLLMHILAGKSGALLHAAGLGMDNRGYIFPGSSGAGKSTLSRLLLGRDGAQMLSDDRMIIRKIDGKFRAFGTPWAGDAAIAENRSVLLDRIFYIHHAETNRVKELKPQEAVERLMPVTSIPWYDEKAIQDMLAFCGDLALNIPAYELYFRPDHNVVTFLEDFVCRNNI
ncbi:MAG: hypothetical protein HZA15_09290 [Nitrospirae bacterium]|nr:hypothetical protein [Nitrospirota bacterium]